jgi:hypothetical protein
MLLALTLPEVGRIIAGLFLPRHGGRAAPMRGRQC